jgi:MFS family permease
MTITLKKRIAEYFKTIFSSLKYKNFRLFFFGEIITYCGSWIQVIALNWLTFSLSKSYFILGIVGFSGLMPVLILTPLTGVLADRFEKKKILIFAQALAMIQALVLALLTLTGLINIFWIIILSVVVGIANALEVPVRHSFLSKLVDKKEDVGNAIALNSLITNGTRLAGPAFAGFLVPLIGNGFCFLANVFTYFVILFALVSIKITNEVIKIEKIDIINDISEGIKYSLNSTLIRDIFILVAFFSFFGISYCVLFPAIVKELFNGNVNILGVVNSFSGLGALFSGILLSTKKSIKGLHKIILISSLLISLSLAGISLSPFSFTNYFFIGLIGFGMTSILISSNMILQNITEKNILGRVLSFYIAGYMGVMSFGNVYYGFISEKIGLTKTLLINGIICFTFTLLLFARMFSLKKQTSGLFFVERKISLSQENSILEKQEQLR